MSENTEALSSRWLPLILLHGAPPPHPTKRDGTDPAMNDLQAFGSYIHDLAVWTSDCRLTYMEWEGLSEDEWTQPYNRCKRLPFENDFINWAYRLKPEEYPDGT